jgi:4'-phosphopantetheinyl transferase EntD
MPVFKLSKSLTNPLDPEWELLTKLTLGDAIHSDRKKGFLLSRDALKQGLNELGIDVVPSALKLISYHQLSSHPELTISLSHTKECGAALIADRKVYRSIGVDVEHEERVVKDSIRARISHKDDQSLRNIELWCLKEAVFKVLMNTDQFEKPMEFSSICIGQGVWAHSPSGLKGEWELDFLKPLVVAKAFLKN